MIFISLLVSFVLWMLFMGFLSLWAWLFGAQLLVARNRWGVLLVCSINLGAFCALFATGQVLTWFLIGVGAPWAIYGYHRLRHPLPRRERAASKVLRGKEVSLDELLSA